jgi:protein phosphatase
VAVSEDLAGEVAADPSLSGMGAAVAGIWLGRTEAVVFNCGDVRVYRSRGGLADRLTRDHSAVHELYLGGRVDHSMTRRHPLGHLVTRAVQEGNPESLEIFARGVGLRTGDLFLICSDALWEAIDDDDIEAILAPAFGSGAGGREADLAEAARHLSERVLAEGPTDDWSLVLLGGLDIDF